MNFRQLYLKPIIWQYGKAKPSYIENLTYVCDQILENTFKSHMKSGVFLHVFNDISIYA